MNIEWTELAIDRVSRIAEYIAYDSPSSADKWIDKIFCCVGRLEEFPESGRHLPETPTRLGLRELIMNNYRVIYKISHTTGFILTVKHSRQILPNGEI